MCRAKPVAITLLVAVAVCLTTGVGRSQRAYRYAVGSIEAKAYLHNQGRFSAGLIDNPKVTLWNTPIGEGTVGGPSDDTFLEVSILGPPLDEPDSLVLSVLAFTASDTLVDHKLEVISFNTNGRFYSAYWLYDTGCEPITIDVHLVGDHVGPGVRRAIPYKCGE